MAYHDSELSPGAVRRLEKHLDTCEECSRLLEKLRLADEHASSAVGVDEMGGLPGGPPPDDKYWESFTSRVLDSVEEDAATKAPDRPRPRRSWDLFIPRMTPAFSIALVVVVAAGLLMKIGGPTQVAKAPVATMEPATERAVPVVGGKDEPPEARRSDGEYSEGLAVERKSPDTVERTPTFEDDYRPEPATLPEPEVASTPEPESVSPPEPEPTPEPETMEALEKIAEGALDLKKKETLAAPGAERKGEEADNLVAAGPETEVAVPPDIDSDEGEVTPVETSESAPEDQPEDTTGRLETAAQETPSPEIAMEDLTANAARNAVPEAARRDTLRQEYGVASPVEPVQLTEPGSVKMDDNVVVAETTPVEVDRASLSAPAPVVAARPDSEPELQQNEPKLFAPAEPPEENRADVSGIQTMGSAPPSRETRQTFASRQLPYRGPQDQLIHARNLADVRKFWESEQVLKDLLSQRLPLPIQEEASILLVKVLSSQNRIGEAQQVLDDARTQFPASEMIQTYELKTDGGRPAQ
jgi:hypothetical protein